MEGKVTGKIVNKITAETPNMAVDRKDQDQGHGKNINTEDTLTQIETLSTEQ